MVSTSKIKSVDFYRKIPRDLTEASLSGAGLSIIAALSMIFLFGMELHSYLSLSTSTSVIVDRSTDGDFLRFDFNISFPALSCEFATVDVSDVLGTNRLNITKTVRKFSIDSNLMPTGAEFHSGPVSHAIKHGDEVGEESDEGSVKLNAHSFDKLTHQYPILVVNFYAPWCYWSNRLKPSWEKAAKIVRERYDPEIDGRIIMGKVDCTQEADLCKSNHIQGYPSIRIFRKGSDVRNDHGHHDHESYYGDRDTDSLVKAMESLVSPIQMESQKLALEDKSEKTAEKVKRPAPRTGGCRIEGYVRVKKIDHYLQIVKTEVFGKGDHKLIEEYEYTAHSSLVESVYVPVVKFHYELSPMQVLITENPKSFSHFLTNVCAIIGGVFTVAGIADSILHNTIRLMRKIELGKNF
ncbi:protein disulfide isomerase-like 5-4 isoform X2 [Tripterygium wilfordii]|uniref:protein disulfide isomerase-like 5-4 isoform X2 n=1 Tax=Tripterygium wilfordii TaxID=458696 RepID=UPI0018F7F02E|nr:protein disulfide isomerase-like 5-4 isoform X2 [Tripterygium wilfordii]